MRWFDSRKRSVVLLEEQDALHFPEVDFTLKAKVDRIDQTPEETFIIYDYKTGTPPTRKTAGSFRQAVAARGR